MTKYGKLSIIKKLGKDKKGYNKVLCKCECSNIKEIYLHHIKSGSIKSCGCLRGQPIKHGLSKTRWNNIWKSMKQRCYNKNNHAYHRYGGRGIKVEWDNILDFYNDMKENYSEELTIDRIDNDGNYSKDNCRWATRKEQSSNRDNFIPYYIKENSII